MKSLELLADLVSGGDIPMDFTGGLCGVEINAHIKL